MYCVERNWETVVAGLNIWSYEDLGYDYLKKQKQIYVIYLSIGSQPCLFPQLSPF